MTETVSCPKCKERLHSNLSAQAYSELLSQLTFLELECHKMRTEIYCPDVLEKHIETLPRIYENLKIILK
jgi:hypothetical protein